MLRSLFVVPVAFVTLLATVAAGSAVSTPAEAAAPPLVAWVPTGDFASSSFERVPQESDATHAAAPDRLSMPVVRNAPQSAQLSVTAKRDLTNLSVEVVERGLPGGVRPLPSDAVTVRFPGYVPVDGTDEVTADPLQTGPVDVKAGHNQPIWLTVDLPKSVRAAKYGAKLRVSADGMDPLVHELVVDVADVTVSDPADYDFYLNMWFQPDSVAYEHDVPVRSPAHWRLMRPYLKDLASRGQKVINASIIEDPWELKWPDGSWSAQTYYPFHTLVDWSYDGDKWSFDYRAFDRYVRANKAAGIGPDIRVYALLMFGGRERLFYRDTRTGESVREVIELGGARWRKAWTAFLDDFESHLRERGWFDDTMLAFDERPSATMQVVRDFLAESAPAFEDKIHIAVYSPDVDHDIPDISYIHGMLSQLDGDVLQRRREAGYRTTFYNVGGPAIPNTITASPPVSARLLSWVPHQYGLDGYLRWSYNSWPSDDPFTDPAYRYAQGDEYIVYPGEDGPTSSIRWETFRDGVIDHELLSQLERRAGANNPAYRQALELIDANSAPSPQLYDDVLSARQVVVSEIEEYADVEVDAVADPSTEVAGEQTEVVATVRNDGSRPHTGVEVDLRAPKGWKVESRDNGDPETLKPGERLSRRFAVTVPEKASSGSVELSAETSLRRNGSPVRLQTSVPVEVQAAVGVTSVSAEPEEVDAQGTTTLTAKVVNRRDVAKSAEVKVDVPAGWTVEPSDRTVDLEPHAARSVTFEATASPKASAGRTKLRAVVSLDGVPVERASTSVRYNEATVADLAIHSVSSEETEGEDGAAANLVDGDPQTHWHSRWSDQVAQPPHEVVLDLGAQRAVHAMTYLPRQTGTGNGTVKDYEVYVGEPGSWGEPVATGAFTDGREVKRVDFTGATGRFVRFVALSEQSGQAFASGAELTVLMAGSRHGPST